jgi:hypothetical protein
MLKVTPLLAAILLPIVAATAPHAARAAPSPEDWFAEQGYVAPAGTRIIACHGYGCARRVALSVDEAWLAHAGALLKAGRASPEAERRALREVIRGYTAYLAASFGAPPDAPRSPPQMSGEPGQMDCLDETANTTSLLLVLQGHGLLAYHEVERPESRGWFLDGRYPHFTAIIAEKQTGREWAVDPWAKPPGQYPEILPLSEWRQDS